jgi:hypothetical protein
MQHLPVLESAQIANKDEQGHGLALNSCESVAALLCRSYRDAEGRRYSIFDSGLYQKLGTQVAFSSRKSNLAQSPNVNM